MLTTIRKATSYQRRTGRLSANRKALLQNSEHLIKSLDDDSLKQRIEESSQVKLEIGFGMGEHLLNNINNEPETLHIGVEIYRPGIAALLDQLQKQNTSNACVIEADATDVVEHLPAKSLHHIDIHHPDPWPKKRHQKRQLLNAVFIAALLEKIKNGGCCHIITDDQDYFDHIVEECDNLCPEKTTKSLEFDRKPNSKYGRKAIQEGRKINAIHLTVSHEPLSSNR